jgi:alkaline phosphatase D
MLLRLAGLLLAVTPLPAQIGPPFAAGPWCGNVSATGATVAVHLSAPGASVRLAVARNAGLADAIYSVPAVTQSAAGNGVKLDIQGLLPDTAYYYGLEIDGVLRAEPASRGAFRTFPLGAASFKIAFASCGDYRAADQRAYDAILAEQPLLFINSGDLHYNDTNTTNAGDYRANYDAVLNQPNQAALYRGVPFAYVWDDHDFSGNDSDGTSPGRDTARRVFDERVPHYAYAVAGGPVAQTLTIGRVRVILTDLRSAADPHDAPDTPAKSHLGAAQKAWFKQELINARDAGFPLILWVSTVPWIGAAGSGDDDWSVFANERRELANFIKANRIKNLVLLCGDMHALAYDDGTNSDYADGGGAPLVVLQAAALTSGASVKGGPYSGGAVAGSQQYGILEITDTGGTAVQCRFTGKRAGEGAKLAFSFATDGGTNFVGGATAGTPVSGTSALVNISAREYLRQRGDTCIVGFVITGTAPHTVLIRAVGPSLARHGVTDAMADPKFSVYQRQAVVAANDNWADAGSAQLSAAFARVGAFTLIDAASKDAATLLTMAPGVYSVVASGADGAAGTVLVEVYDVP